MDKTKLFKISVVLVITIVVIMVSSVVVRDNNTNQNEIRDDIVQDDHNDNSLEYSRMEIPSGFEYYIEQPQQNLKLNKEKVDVKGIYLTGWTVGSSDKFNSLIKLVNETELNSMVIDVKEDKGRVTYNSEVQWVKNSGSITNMVGNMEKIMNKLKKNNIYTIARIVCFKDTNLCSIHPELAIKTKDGKVWRDNKGNAWLNPYNKESWEYLVELSKEAVTLGFNDIQYDYVRFPTDGNVRNIDYGKLAETKTKSEVISEFLAYASQELTPMGVDISADIYGIVPIVDGDYEGIGQSLIDVSRDIDYICPMVYPSHFANIRQNGVGQKINGILYKYPDLDPYGVVYNTLISGRKRLSEVKVRADVRPWLQAFTADYLHEGTYQYYGGKEIREQIQATYDAGYTQWLLWNPSNNYKYDGLERK